MHDQINFPIVEYPIIAFVGNRGGGKTLLMTAMAVDEFHKTKRMIFSNYTLYGIKYTYMPFEEMIANLETLHNCWLLIDEAHVGIDSYDFLSKSTQKVTQFVTQIRKRQITMLITTQRFGTIAKRFRQQVDYIVWCNRTSMKGVSKYTMYDYENKTENTVLWEKVLDLRGYFKYYNTNELVLIKEKENKSN